MCHQRRGAGFLQVVLKWALQRQVLVVLLQAVLVLVLALAVLLLVLLVLVLALAVGPRSPWWHRTRLQFPPTLLRRRNCAESC
jgi:hypothetical protein